MNTQKGPTQTGEDTASCIMMSENPTKYTHRDHCRHVDVKVHFLRDPARDGHVKLVKCAGTQNVSECLRRLDEKFRPAFDNWRDMTQLPLEFLFRDWY
jgi:hypothetical protein